MLLLDKASGMTSNYALQGARRLFSAAKAGHTGTLDPLATGLLPLCFGEATKFSADLLEADKVYEADLLFGVSTATGDCEGSILERRPVTCGRPELETALRRFHGTIAQIPPMYSALKRDGRPLYELARQGIEVERQPRQVTIKELLLIDFSVDRCRLRVACSKGTYIRTLAEDIGKVLGCGAHLTALRRLAVGALEVADALTLEHLNGLSEAGRAACLLPPDVLLQKLPEIRLDEAAALRFMHGNSVSFATDLSGDGAALTGKCRVYDAHRLLGLGQADAAGEVRPRRLVCA